MARDRVPTVETYRGVGVHDFQPRERIDGVVKPAIDFVATMSDPVTLAAYAGEAQNPPEARLFAAARCEAAWELSARNREIRPDIDLTRVKASVAGLDCLGWIDPFRYRSLLDWSAVATKREMPLSGI